MKGFKGRIDAHCATYEFFIAAEDLQDARIMIAHVFGVSVKNIIEIEYVEGEYEATLETKKIEL